MVQLSSEVPAVDLHSNSHLLITLTGMYLAFAATVSLAPPSPDQLRWRAAALNPDAWKQWFSDQLALAPNASPDRGLYVGLRLDGRVRASGMGQPPWARFAVELAPLEGEGKWTGFFDGFDGKV
eukprot:GHRR01035218.1.p1 GENE.GHRR01035218.1~~GHRR01035218.1.p1  ORF type:complete len:124 (+),score=30.38 GHRR01035218.1:194-565(+)